MVEIHTWACVCWVVAGGGGWCWQIVQDPSPATTIRAGPVKEKVNQEREQETVRGDRRAGVMIPCKKAKDSIADNAKGSCIKGGD